jgi:hypothetical protein
MEYEERHGAEIEAKRAELRFIEDSINSVDDPMERMVLRIRYTGSENAKPMPWRSIRTTSYLSQREIISALDYCSHEHLLQSDYAIISLKGQNA